MRTRESQINIRMTTEEKNAAEFKANCCGLTLSNYIRQLLDGNSPKAAPPIEYLTLVQTMEGLYSQLACDDAARNKLVEVLNRLEETLMTPDKAC